MTTETTTLTGHEAITYAEAFDARLQKYADPIEDARHDLTPEEARDVATEDPSLIYITLELEHDLDGDQVAVIDIPEDVETETRILYAGTYLVAMPPEYDREIVTAEDILHDGLVYIIYEHGPAQDAAIGLDGLTRLIRSEERARAPGSETVLWGEYCERMRQVTGHLPSDDIDDPPTVTLVEAAWWLGAYHALADVGHYAEHGADAPTAAPDGTIEHIRGQLGLAPRGAAHVSDEVDDELRAGYEWYHANHRPQA